MKKIFFMIVLFSLFVVDIDASENNTTYFDNGKIKVEKNGNQEFVYYHSNGEVPILQNDIEINPTNNPEITYEDILYDGTMIGDGQTDPIFPDQNPSSREYVNDKRLFTAYTNHAEILVRNQEDTKVTSATIEVNGNLVDVDFSEEEQAINITEYVINGDNTLEVSDIKPEGAVFEIYIPYPTLTVAEEGVDTSEFDELINQDIEDGFSGAQAVAVKNGEIVINESYGYGLRYDSDGNEVDNPEEVTEETLFDLASNTKMFATLMAIQKLSYEEELSYDDHVYDYIQEFTGGYRDDITIGMLLNHTSGFGPEVLFFDPDNSYGLYSQDSETTKKLIIEDVPIENEPNTKTVYSDTNYMLLAILVEEITGQDFDVYLEQNIYTPLGLENTTFNPLDNGYEKNEIAATDIQGHTNLRGYDQEFPNQLTDVLQGEVNDDKAYYSFDGVTGHAGLFSTASDLAILAQMDMNGGGYGYVELYDQTTVNETQTTSLLDQNRAYGWDKMSTNNSKNWEFGTYVSESGYGHTGFTGTLSVIDPEQDMVYIMLTNKRHSPVNDSGNPLGNYYETGRYGSPAVLAEKAIIENEHE